MVLGPSSTIGTAIIKMWFKAIDTLGGKRTTDQINLPVKGHPQASVFYFVSIHYLVESRKSVLFFQTLWSQRLWSWQMFLCHKLFYLIWKKKHICNNIQCNRPCPTIKVRFANCSIELICRKKVRITQTNGMKLLLFLQINKIKRNKIERTLPSFPR